MALAEREPPAFGPYVIDKQIGMGGMGVVFEAHHATTSAPVAIKKVRLRSPELLAAFRREIHALAMLRHPGIVRILDHGTTGDAPWYAMDLVPGLPLSRLLTTQNLLSGDAPISRVQRTGPAGTQTHAAPADADDAASPAPLRSVALPRGECLRLGRAICRALSFMHGHGLVHRDLKPDNILIQPDGSPVLVDFGLVIQFGGREVLDVAESAGTLVYMAPEQRFGRFVDARADLYSLGCLLYQCLCGALPFGPLGMPDWSSTIPLPPSAHNPELGTDFDALLARLLAKDPKDRLGYADDVEAALALIEGVENELPSQRSVYLYRSELAGRDALLRRLEAGMSAARGEQPSVVLVSGESGGGKTRLVMELATRAAEHGMRVVTGDCPPIGTDAEGLGLRVAPLRPFRQFLLTVAEDCRHRGAAQTRYLFGGGRARALAAYEPSLNDLDLEGGAPLPPAPSPEAARGRLFSCLGGLLLDYARTRPLLLALDDLQWADDLSLEFLGWLASAPEMASGAYAVVATYRVEETSDALKSLSLQPRAVSESLALFDRAAIRQMVAGMLALPDPPESLVDFVDEESRGNPFFISEYLRAAIEAGLLRRDAAGRWRLAFAGESAGLRERVMPPPTIAAMVALRLKDLDPTANDVLNAAAVLGREFDVDLVAKVAARDATSVLSAYATLSPRHILEEGTTGVSRFAHDRLREIVYSAVGAETRAELHARAAAALEERHAGHDIRPYLGDLGYHHARARSHEQGAGYYERAGYAAQEAYANGDAARFYQLALEQLARLPESPELTKHRQDLQEQAGDALLSSGKPQEARALFGVALQTLPRSSETIRRKRKLAQTWEREHQHAEALRVYAEAEAELGHAPAPGEGTEAWWHEYVQIHVGKGWALYFSARVDELSALVQSVRPAVFEHGTPRQKTQFLVTMVQAATKRDRFRINDETLEVARSLLDAAAETQDPRELATARFTCAFVLMMRGMDEEAEPLFAIAIEDAKRVDDTMLRIRSQSYHSITQRRLGRLAEAEETAQRLLAEAEERQMLDYIGVARANLAWCAHQRGAHQDVEPHAAAALAAWEKLPNYVYPLQWLARLPLAAHFHSVGRKQAALEQAAPLLVDPQHHLPDELHSAIERALEAPYEQRFDDVTAAARRSRFL